MNAEISETIQAATLGLDMQILETPVLRKFVTRICPAHSNAHKLTKTVAPIVFILQKFKLKCI